MHIYNLNPFYRASETSTHSGLSFRCKICYVRVSLFRLGSFPIPRLQPLEFPHNFSTWKPVMTWQNLAPSRSPPRRRRRSRSRLISILQLRALLRPMLSLRRRLWGEPRRRENPGENAFCKLVHWVFRRSIYEQFIFNCYGSYSTNAYTSVLLDWIGRRAPFGIRAEYGMVTRSSSNPGE